MRMALTAVNGYNCRPSKDFPWLQGARPLNVGISSLGDHAHLASGWMGVATREWPI
jgi:hypothetical protein